MQQRKKTWRAVLALAIVSVMLSVLAACSSKLSGKYYYYDAFDEKMYDFYIEFKGEKYQWVTADGDISGVGTVKYNDDNSFVLYDGRGEAGTGVIVGDGVIYLEEAREDGYFCKKDATLPKY